VFYFENNCLKFEQSFKFGFDIILRDISKITLLKKEFIEKFLEQVEFDENISDEELVEKELFEDGNYKKIKKKLIFEIAKARIVETLELIILKNINFKHYNKTSKTVFFQFNEAFNFKSIRETYKAILSQKGIIDTRYLDELSHDNTVDTANKLVHFGWKKEVIPFTKTKKSLIARFFSAIFE
jgi:cell division ATPase FtsA